MSARSRPPPIREIRLLVFQAEVVTQPPAVLNAGGDLSHNAHAACTSRSEWDPPNLRELSERETLEVVDLIRKEFKVDDDRTYLMGHSMGGAGTLYLAIKYPQRWAAIAALAPAAFAVDREGLSKIPKMPIMLVHGDADTVVPVTVGRAWAEAMRSIPMQDTQYIEVPGGDHGTVIGSHQAEIFAFFARHSR